MKLKTGQQSSGLCRLTPSPLEKAQDLLDAGGWYNKHGESPGTGPQRCTVEPGSRI